MEAKFGNHETSFLSKATQKRRNKLRNRVGLVKDKDRFHHSGVLNPDPKVGVIAREMTLPSMTQLHESKTHEIEAILRLAKGRAEFPEWRELAQRAAFVLAARMAKMAKEISE